MSRPAAFFARSLAIVALVGGLALSPAVYAASSSSATDAPATAQKNHKAMSPEERVEHRIRELHAKLKITPEQAQLWENVANTMKENEMNMHALIVERHENTGNRTALEDLESYQKIAAAHADALSKFAQAFQPLYDAMPDAQKKNADTVFGTYEGHSHEMPKAGKTK
jgi:hypothetical protein